MKIEFKRFTTNARLSQETTAFAADVWVDGKKVGTARNDGRGGCHLVHLDPSVRDAVETYGKAHVPAEFARYTSGIEWAMQMVLDAELQQRADKVFQKKIAKADAKEKAYAAQHGWCAARFRHDDTWEWFVFNPGTDPKIRADMAAAKRKVIVDEVVVL
jgi:hypothetical protein